MKTAFALILVAVAVIAGVNAIDYLPTAERPATDATWTPASVEIPAPATTELAVYGVGRSEELPDAVDRQKHGKTPRSVAEMSIQISPNKRARHDAGLFLPREQRLFSREYASRSHLCRKPFPSPSTCVWRGRMRSSP